MATDGRGQWTVDGGLQTTAVETAPEGDCGRHETGLRRLGKFQPSPRRGGSPPQRRGEVVLRLPLALLLALALLLIPTLVAADQLDDQVRAIARELRCPVCSGETVADSNAQVSVQIRGIIRQKLEAGETPDQIKAYFVARYGESILLSPEAKGFTLGVWVAPIVALVVGLAIVLTVLRSWLRRAAPVAVTPVAATVPTLPDDEDARLEQELAQYRRGGGGVRG